MQVRKSNRWRIPHGYSDLAERWFLADGGLLIGLVRGRDRAFVGIVAPLAHGVAHGEDLALKTGASFANPHVRAQLHAFDHR
jgi:hypothetical protein